MSICNGCGESRKLTKEHLISLPIGRVIVGRRNIDTTSMRRLLKTDYLQTQLGDDQGDAPSADRRLDVYVENLLCRECNEGWAIELEEAVGPVLYDFVHARGRLRSIPDLKRWMAFFAIKAGFYYERTEALSEGGPYYPLLGKLSNPAVAVEFPLYVARLDVNRKRWRIGFAADPLLDQWPVMLWIHFHGVLFVLAAPGVKPRTNMRHVSDGLRYVDTVVVPKKHLRSLMPPYSEESLDRYWLGQQAGGRDRAGE